MNKTEVGLFRYMCRQTDYNKSAIYTARWNFVDPSGKEQNIERVSVKIVFQKYITDIVQEYANKINANYKDLMTIVNRWYHIEGSMIVKEFRYEEIREKYWLRVSINNDRSNKYYDIIPYRVFNKLNKCNDAKVHIPQPSYEYFTPKVSDVEKKYFRFLIRNYNKKKSYYDGDTFYIKIDDYDDLYDSWVRNPHHGDYSKNVAKKFIRKWKSLGMFYRWDKRNNSNSSVFEISEGMHKYIRIIPKNILKRFKKEPLVLI